MSLRRYLEPPASTPSHTEVRWRQASRQSRCMRAASTASTPRGIASFWGAGGLRVNEMAPGSRTLLCGLCIHVQPRSGAIEPPVRPRRALRAAADAMGTRWLSHKQNLADPSAHVTTVTGYKFASISAVPAGHPPLRASNHQ